MRKPLVACFIWLLMTACSEELADTDEYRDWRVEFNSATQIMVQALGEPGTDVETITLKCREFLGENGDGPFYRAATDEVLEQAPEARLRDLVHEYFNSLENVFLDCANGDGLNIEELTRATNRVLDYMDRLEERAD